MNYAPKPATVKGDRAQNSDAIDREPLTGKARNEFEAGLHARVKRSQQLVLRIILDFAGGKAECWPGNQRIADVSGYKPRTIQVILKALETADVIRRVDDGSLCTRRRIVILDHPNAHIVLARMGNRSWMHSGAQSSAIPAVENPDARAQMNPDATAHNNPDARAQDRLPYSKAKSKHQNSSSFSTPQRHPGGRKKTQAELVAEIMGLPAHRAGGGA